MGEVIVEVVIEIACEVMGLALSRYMPKWIRVLVLTIIACVIEFIVLILAHNNKVIFAVLSILIWGLWIFFINEILRVRFKKSLYAKIDENNEFIGKRTIGGDVCGIVKTSNSSLSSINETVSISFKKDDMYFKSYKKESEVIIDEQKIDFLKKMINDEELYFQSIVKKARKQIPDCSCSPIVTKIIWNEGKEIDISFVFKEKDRRKSYIVKESMSYI